MENLEESLGRFVDLADRKDITLYLTQETSSFLKKLDSVWDETGIQLDDRKQRGYRVIEHVKSLFNDMLIEAAHYKNSLAEKITSLLQELSELGQELKIDTAVDVNGLECMPLNMVIDNLEKKIKIYKNMHASVLNEIIELNEKATIVLRKLGKTDKYLDTSPIPAPEDINAFKIYCINMSKELIDRENIFSKIKTEIIQLINDLCAKPSLEFEKNVLKETESTFKLSDDNMERLKNWHVSLKNQQKDMHSKIADLREKISMFWERLEESPERRSQFLNAYPGNSFPTYQALREEELRCKNEIKANMKLFIDKMRQEIIKWWEECYYGEDQKNEFMHYNSDCYNEDLLTLHEMYIDKLKKHFYKNKHIYDLISKRTELWKRLLELEERAINPDRLKNRGGQLLREEKERNSVRARLPKVEDQLCTLIEAYEEEHQKPFTILGQRLSDMIETDREAFKENRQVQLSAKKEAREKLKTPMKSPARVGTPHLTQQKTPSQKTPAKRRLAMPLFGSASAKRNRSLLKKDIPKIQVNGSTLNKRVSLERRKRLERKRNSGKKRSSKSSNTTDYDHFELDLANKSTTCRSTLGTELANINNNAGPSGTCGTPYLPRTPSRTTLRSKSPAYGANLRSKSPANAANRLTPAPGNLPIII